MTLTHSLLKTNIASLGVRLPTRMPSLLLILGVTLLFGAGLGSARSFTFHESHIAQGAREMLATGDWLIPRVGGRPWLEKPPLPQWLAAVSGAILGGVSEFAARLPAALFGLLGVMMFGSLITRCRGERTGLITGLLLATSTSIITYARLAEPDIILWGIIVAALCCFAKANVEATNSTSKKAAIAFFILLGLTQTVKGPLFGAVLTLAPCAVWLAWHRFENWKWFASPLGIALTVIIAFAWPVAVMLQYPEAMALWRTHTVGRLDSATAFNPKPVWYYLTTLPWQAAPAFLLALPALPTAFRNAVHQPKSLDRFLMTWFASMFVLLTAASAKHHHYLIHALPPFAYWASQGLPWYGRQIGRLWSFTWYRRVSPVVFAAIIGVAAWQVSKQGMIRTGEILGLGFAVLASLTVIAEACRRGKETIAATVFLVLLIGVTTYANVAWLGRNDIYQQDADLAHRLMETTAPDEAIIIYKIDPARILLDMDRRVIVIDEADELFAAIRPGQSQRILTVMLYSEELQRLLPLTEVDRTPQPKWPDRPISHTVVYKTAN